MTISLTIFCCICGGLIGAGFISGFISGRALQAYIDDEWGD